MKLLYQIAAKHKLLDWEITDSCKWSELGNFPINALCIQGDVWCGADLYGVRALSNGEVEIAAIHDSTDWPLGQRWSRVTRYIPLRPDPRPEYGGAINSYKTTRIYADDLKPFLIHRIDPLCMLLPWNDFDKTVFSTKHGIWLPDQHFDELERSRKICGWREWSEHLAPEELDQNGRVLDQTTLGRKVKPEGTQTFIQYSGTATDYAHNAVNKHTLLKRFGSSNSSTASNITGDTMLFVFCAQEGAPFVGSWPTSGTYRCQLDVSSASSNLAYGLLNFGSAPGHFGRTGKEHSSCIQGIQQDESSFSGSGLKLATIVDPSWSSGSHFDQLEVLISGTRTSGHSKESITLDLNRPDSYVDGPWEPVPVVLQAMHVF